MGGEQDGLSPRRQLAHLLPHRPPRLDIHAERGFIETDEVGIAAQREREEHALFLSAGERAKEPLLQALQTGDRQQLIERPRVGRNNC